MSLVHGLQIASTLFMTGLIWFVQIVHYPLFARVEPSAFAPYAEQHARLTTRVVGPAMAVELITALLLLLWAPPAAHLPWLVAGLLLLGVIWFSTAFIQVPQHERLRRGFERRAHETLVRWNWIRTLAWSMRALLVLWLILPSSS